MSDPDKTPPPAFSPEIRAVLERLDGLEAGHKTAYLLLDSKLDAVIDGMNERHAAVMSELATIKDTQAKHARILTWMKKAISDLVEWVDEFRREYVAFQEHVFSQFQRTSLRVVAPPEEHNGNGTHGE